MLSWKHVYKAPTVSTADEVSEDVSPNMKISKYVFQKYRKEEVNQKD